MNIVSVWLHLGSWERTSSLWLHGLIYRCRIKRQTGDKLPNIVSSLSLSPSLSLVMSFNFPHTFSWCAVSPQDQSHGANILWNKTSKTVSQKQFICLYKLIISLFHHSDGKLTEVLPWHESTILIPIPTMFQKGDQLLRFSVSWQTWIFKKDCIIDEKKSLLKITK